MYVCHSIKISDNISLIFPIAANKQKTKDSLEEKKQKFEGRAQLRAGNQNPEASGSNTCNSCGQHGHNSARATSCPNHPLTIEEKEKQVLGNSREKFTRRIPLRSIVRPHHHDQLLEKINQLSTHMREIIVRCQMFLNSYILDLSSGPIPSYIYSQQCLYSICQLVLGNEVTNPNSNLPADIRSKWEQFARDHPDAIYHMMFNGYSDTLSSACKLMAETYVNHITENFQGYLVRYCKHMLKRAVPVSDFISSYASVTSTLD